MKAAVFLYIGTFLQALPGIDNISGVAEKLTLTALLALGVYVLYKRDVAKEKKMDELQNKIFDIEKNSIAAITAINATFEKMNDTLKSFNESLNERKNG